MNAGTTSGEHLSIERIAAFLDGRLTGATREGAILHLAECEECYELFAETARFLREDEREHAAGEPEASVVERARVLRPPVARWRRAGWLTATIAAAAAGVLAVLVWTPDGDFPDSPTVAELAASLPPAASLSPVVESSWQTHGWPVKRGTGSALGADEELAFQIGVRVIETEIALAAADAELARSLSQDLATLLDEVGSADPLVVLYGGSAGLPGSLDAGAPTADLLELHRQGDRLLAGDVVDPDWYSLGKWVGAARLAAAAGEADFFTDRTRLRELRRFARGTAPSEVAAPLRRLAALVAEDPERRLPEIERTLDELIAVAGGGGRPGE